MWDKVLKYREAIISTFMCYKEIKTLFSVPFNHSLDDAPTMVHQPELSGQLTKWLTELSKYDITYSPRMTVKSQVFLTSSPILYHNWRSRRTLCHRKERSHVDFISWWVSCTKGSGLRIVLYLPKGDVIKQSVCCEFKAKNNETEYEALITELTLSQDMLIKKIKVYNDSELIVNQIMGEY